MLEGAEANFIFAVVGSAGAFRTEAVIMNRLNRSQLVDAYYLPLGAANCNVGATRLFLDANTWYFYSDFVFDVFHQTGFGSVVIFGVTSSGANDSSARIDGNARIWSLATGGGTASQNFPAMSIAVPSGDQSAFGLRKDEFYRTNWGIFNYGTSTRTFDITFNGLRGFFSISANITPMFADSAGSSGWSLWVVRNRLFAARRRRAVLRLRLLGRQREQRCVERYSEKVAHCDHAALEAPRPRWSGPGVSECLRS